MRPIDADALKRRAQKVATESWKMKIEAKVETILNQFIDWINEAPTIQAEPHWILCSERLPEEDMDVLCQTFSGARFVASYGILNPWDKEKGWITSEFNRFSKEMIKVWMPLPERYRD